MAYIFVAPNTTYCERTSANHAEFERRLARMQNGTGRTKRTAGETVQEALNRQISRENKRLRELSRMLPGHEPDRFF